MTSSFPSIAAYLAILVFVRTVQGQVARFVDPFLGATGDGNVFVGPTVPFGMIKPGPDMRDPSISWDQDPNAGWLANGEIVGFSQTHVSGTGGAPKYGNILIMPSVGPINPLDSRSAREDEQASAGYYSVKLKRNSIGVDISTTRRAAIYRLRYPQSSRSNLIFDVSHCLLGSEKYGESQAITASQVHVISPTEVEGSTSVTGGWNMQPNSYTVYFYARTNTPSASWGTWIGDHMQPGVHRASSSTKSSSGAWLTFSTHARQEVLLKIAISFVSMDRARRTLDAEIPDFNFERVHAAAVAQWNHALSKVEIAGATPDQAKIFYTAVYHTMLMPADRNEENPLWHSTEPYYDDYFTIWDIFRTSLPLLTLIAPERETAIVRALIDIYRHEGWLPDGRSGNYNGRTQGGSNAEFVLTDAYVKGLKGIDWKAALAAEIHDAEASPANHFKEGRGGLEDWHKLGYVSIEGSDRPASVSMEYAADDFEIALLAKGLHDTENYRKYLARSANWKNLWDDGFKEGGFTGFVRPRYRDGNWLTPFTAMDDCSWGGKTFYEGNSWTYSTFVPHDVASLISKSGGPQLFVRRLDALFDVPSRYDVGNEPGFLAPYLYIWAGRPDKTSFRIRQIIAKNFHSGMNGLPGNDDSGALSSWFAFGQIGIFPNAGQDVYLIGSPAFSRTTLHLANGRDFVIDAQNLSAENLYVATAELNGKPLNRAWLRHREISAGGHLVLNMARSPSHWAENDFPPSTSAAASASAVDHAR